MGQITEYYYKWAKYERIGGETARVERDDAIGLDESNNDHTDSESEQLVPHLT